jgi:hypothetical protein
MPRSLLAILWLLCQPVVFHWKTLISKKGTIPFDLPAFHMPLAAAVVDALRDHRFPWWDPYIYAGYPLHADLQAQILYPPAWLVFWKAVARESTVLYWLEWENVLHVSLAGILAWWLLRRAGCGRWPALFGATVYQLGCFFCSQIQHLGAVCGAAWMPLVWLAILELAGGFSAPWFAALAGALAMAFLAGFPAMILVVYGSALAVAGGFRLSRRAPAWLLLWTGLGVLASMVLVAAQLVPTVLWGPHSQTSLRWTWASGGGLPPKALWSVLWPDWFHVFTPDRYREPFNLTFMYLYHGQAALWLLLAAPWLRTRLPARLFAILVIVFALVMLGSSVPGAEFLFTLLPHTVRGAAYVEFALAAFSLSFAVAAALALEHLTRGRRVWIAGLVAVLTSVELIAVASNRFMNFGEGTWKAADSPGNWFQQPAMLRQVQDWLHETVPPARTDTTQREFRLVAVVQAVRVPSLSGDNPLAPLRMLAYRKLFCQGDDWTRFYTVENVASPLLRAGGVGFLLRYGNVDEKDEASLRQAGWDRIAWEPPAPLAVFRTREPASRYYLAEDVRRAGSETEARDLLRTTDPRRVAIVEGQPAWITPPAGPRIPVKVVSYRPDRIELETNAAGPAWLVAAESWAPDWRALVDGRAADLYPTNLAFQGLPLGAGQHHVTLEYVPRATYAAIAVSGLAWLGMTVWAIRRRKKDH